VLSFLDWFPENRCKGPLEKGVVYDVVLVIFAFDNPVTGANLMLPQIGDNLGSLGALGRFYQQWPSCTKSIHGLAPSGLNTDETHLNSQPIKKVQRQNVKAKFSPSVGRHGQDSLLLCKFSFPFRGVQMG
jgi:hypothetical protein